MSMDVEVVGAEAIAAKLDFDALVQPGLDRAMKVFERRILDQGTGLGAKRNILTPRLESTSLVVQTTLIWPRTRGIAWGQFNEEALGQMAPEEIEKVAQEAEAAWGTA